MLDEKGFGSKTVLVVGMLLALALGACALREAALSSPPAGSASDPERIRLFGALGEHHRAISTRSPEVQRWFDQGLTLMYGFNHEAAVRSYEEAALLEPGCGMCWWGVALALGPNINAPMGPEAGRRAYAAAQRALALAGGLPEDERAYIEALALRYAPDPAAAREPLDSAYADAMLALQKRFPEDLDAATLTAEALMDRTPWDYWETPETPRPHMVEALALLERVMERAPQHPGANHYYIHAVEKYHPERAVQAAERLAALAPDAGHLVHMPSHIFWRVGRYEEALEINRRAAAADEAYFAWCRAAGRDLYRAMYYPHNVHFLWAAALAEGRGDLALSTGRKLVAVIPPELLETFPPAEEWLAMPLFTLLRFGRWDAVLGEPRPDPGRAYQTGIWHYARALAQARRGALAEAAAERAAAAALLEAGAVSQLEFVYEPAADYLRLALHHLDGELAALRGDSAAAQRELAAAIAIQDGFQYTEPPRWFFPVRQALGAVLLDAGRPADAEAVYRADLEQNPKNGWSLFGLAASLRAQGREVEANAVTQGFAHAWARADVKLAASRF